MGIRIAWRVMAGVSLVSLLGLAGSAQATAVDDALKTKSMYGINRVNGNLVRYDFGGQRLTTVGAVRDKAGAAMLGIDAAAYFPGFPNLYALWANPSDNKNKLVYVDVLTGLGTVVNPDVEGGRFTGAVGLATAASPWTVFAVQAAKIKPPATISGLVNINPNNNADNEFTCTRGNGTTFTRDDLQQKNATVAGDGTYYQGPCTAFRVKPKGNGNQNGLIIDGKAYALQNSNTYAFTGDMQVRVYNDKINGGKAMGHWWLQVISGTVTINGEAQVLTPNRIAKVDQRTGVVTEVMPLSRTYAGLASLDAQTFYAASGADLYAIDTVGMTETRVNTMSLGKVSDFEFADSWMMGYDLNQTVMAPVSPATGATQASPVNYGLGQLGPIMFTPAATDPARRPVGSFD